MIKHVDLELLAEALDEHAIVSIADSAGNITYVNDKFIEISGFTRNELIGKNHRILKSGLHDAEFFQQMWDTLLSGKTWHGEVCNRRRDGTRYWLRASIKPVLDNNGLPVQYISIRTDITQVKENQERLAAAQQLAHLGSFEWNPQSGDLQWSDEHFRLWGLEPKSVTPNYELFRKVIHPDDVQRLESVLQRALQGGGNYDIEHRVIWPDGSLHHIYARGNVAFDHAGLAIRMVGTVQDITRIKLLSRETEQFKSTLDQALDCVFMFDAEELNFFYANQGARNQVGYGIEELRTMHPYDIKSVGSEAEFRTLIHPLLAGQQESLTFETVHRHKNGHLIQVEVFLQYIAPLGETARFVAIVRDITERHLAEQHLIAARDEAERANMAKSEFLSSMSHELRTPMNAIIGFGQLMECDDTLSDENKDNVHEILRAGHHLLGLINDVLDLAKVESGHLDMSLEYVEVSPLINECMSLVSTLADKRDINLSYKGLEGAAVRADRTRLNQALLNLLSNAIKYNRQGGSVHIEALPAGKDRLCIRVTDTGQGVSATRLAELFQPFNRLDAENSGIEGTGIGLTITRRIVEMMGGIVEVESKVGVGSTFWIELPLDSMCETVQGQELEKAGTPESGMDVTLHTILYIEDNPANLKLVARILGQRKHIRLLTAHTPDLGIELAMTQHPEMILLDINMPGMSGYQVLEILKADALLKSIPVIAVTANAMTRDIERGKAAGFADYLTKPLDIVKFNALLDKLLGQAVEALHVES